MSQHRSGGCQCGQVRYRITGAPLAVIACHCTDCQQQSGGAFSMSMVVEANSFEILEGSPNSFVKIADSGKPSECFFCPACGNRIYNKPEVMAGRINVKPGTLDDTSDLVPAMHVWVRSKQPWVVIPEGMPSFDQNPG